MPKAQRVGSTPATTDALADRIRAAIPEPGRTERRMFGGVGFMLNGNMIAGTFRGALLVRVGKDRNAEALKRRAARPMEMRGRPLAGYVMVDEVGLDDAALKDWVGLALGYVRTLPPKPAKPKPSRKDGGRK